MASKTGNEIHTPHKVVPSIYKVIIKKEFDYFAGILKVKCWIDLITCI